LRSTSEVGEHHIEVVELSGHRVQSGGQLIALNLERCVIAECLGTADGGATGALPTDVGQPAVDFVEFSREASEQTGQPVTVGQHPGQHPARRR
jgi:hypothetical protein